MINDIFYFSIIILVTSLFYFLKREEINNKIDTIKKVK